MAGGGQDELAGAGKPNCRSTSSVRVRGGVEVTPLEVTSELLVDAWSYDEGEEDLTVMRVVAEGVSGGRSRKLTWDLFDRYDPRTGFTSMARTTAFPCALMAREIASGRFTEPGVITP